MRLYLLRLLITTKGFPWWHYHSVGLSFSTRDIYFAFCISSAHLSYHPLLYIFTCVLLMPLSIRISDLDSYQQLPSHLDQFQDAPKVPVIRIYGALRALIGTYNVLLHVHNYYPYLYIDCPEKDLRHVDTEYTDKLARYLDWCLAESFSRNKGDLAEEDISSADDDDIDGNNNPQEVAGTLPNTTNELGGAQVFSSEAFRESLSESHGNTPIAENANSPIHSALQENPYIASDDTQKQFVASVKACRACLVYGYSVGYSLMLKILLLLPSYKTKLFRLLNESEIDFAQFSSPISETKLTAPSLNVYEAHINYYSQFLADFNLYGCGWLDIKECYFRSPILTCNLRSESLLKDLEEHIAHNNVLSPTTYPRMGRSLLEMDIQVNQILNRENLRERDVHNDFSEFKTPTPQKNSYLSSLGLTFDDLKFQCESRGLRETSKILNELYSQVFARLGLRGYADWEFSPEQKLQLTYVTQLNKPGEYCEPDSFYMHNIECKLPLHTVPTAFQLVTQTIAVDYYEKVQKLNFRDDLVKWDSLDNLLAVLVEACSNGSVVVSSPVVSHLEPDNDDRQTYLGRSNLEPSIYPNADIFKDTEQKIFGSLAGAFSSSPMEQEEPTKGSPGKNETFYRDISIFSHTQCGLVHPCKEPLVDSASSLSQTTSFLVRNPINIYEYMVPPQLKKDQFATVFSNSGMLEYDYHDPSYFSKEDTHDRPLVFANRKIIVPLKDESTVPKFKTSSFGLEYIAPRKEPSIGQITCWQYAITAPNRTQVSDCINRDDASARYKRQKSRTQMEPALIKTCNFKDSPESTRVRRSHSDFPNLTQLLMELHANTETEVNPNPSKDSISLIVFYFDDSNEMHNEGNPVRRILVNAQLMASQNPANIARFEIFAQTKVSSYPTEKSMIKAFCNLVDLYDPDILSGYEVNSSSWGYLCERYQTTYNGNILARLSRVTFKGNGKQDDRWGYTHTSLLKINGRHMLNVWRIFRLEISLLSYSLESVCLYILHHTLPKMSNLSLSRWLKSDNFGEVVVAFRYFRQKIDVIMRMIEMKELILKNEELSRLIGIDFYSNFYRGSQFKVESILIRIAKPENLILNSPSKTDIHNMRPLEVIPLIMEPDSAFYKSPLVVLDFQSLYPSIMIAYNYCYSTILGKMEGFKQSRNPIGYMKHHQLPEGIIEVLSKNDGIEISPNGLMFVSAKFRKSILSRMLQEILNMRINVKAVAAAFSNVKELQKLYNSKQLALKLIANVTYGYTSASFSGRMPSSDLADAIVATGREIMRKAISVIEESGHNAKVVYGDTDSLFVYFPGKSKADAFKRGKELAQTVTDIFPDPIRLKFEKVYHPCVLLAKKRYVGNCYECETQESAEFEAKGIETIRRDGVPAQLKMVGKCLRILFETKNLSLVKSYVVEQFHKILQNQVDVSDFCFAKEVRIGKYKNEKHLPPGAVIAKRLVKSDPRRVPQYRERVPYIVIRDSNKERVKDRSVTPEEYVDSFKSSTPMELDHDYYITRVLIPPLERIFNLLGVNVGEWYREIPRTTKSTVVKKSDILYVGEKILTRECYGCGQPLKQGQKWICSDCKGLKSALVALVIWTEKAHQVCSHVLSSVCESCCFQNFSEHRVSSYCRNHDCRIYYKRMKAERELLQIKLNAKVLDSDEDIY